MSERSQVKVGSEYTSSGRTKEDEILTGKVLELVEGERIARVELTKPANVMMRTNSQGNPEPTPVGEILRVFLPMVSAKAVR